MEERKLDRKELLKKAGVGTAALASLPALAGTALASGGARKARWDIISLNPVPGVGAPPFTISAGGLAEAKAPDGTKIRLTGSGTFVAPAGNNGGSNAVTGGGTWTTFDPAIPPIPPAPTGSGTYEVRELVSFVLANSQDQTAPFIDAIGDTKERANGTAVLRIQYSDGQPGVLVVGCHGPGAPPGIFEGIAVTKGFKTYDAVQAPTGNANRTIFHVS